MRRHGTPRSFDFEPQAHWDLGPALGVIDFERATKISGARFAVLMGAGARLARALIEFMLDLHTREHGFVEVEPPFLVNAASLIGTGNLPKFEADLFKIGGDWDLYWFRPRVPADELHRGEILEADRLPTSTRRTRRASGARGRMAPTCGGMIRQHSSTKSSLSSSRTPETSYDELEKLTLNAEEVPQETELNCRTERSCCARATRIASAKSTMSRSGCPARTPTARFHRAANTKRPGASRQTSSFVGPARARPSSSNAKRIGVWPSAARLIAFSRITSSGDGWSVIPEALRPFTRAGRDRARADVGWNVVR